MSILDLKVKIGGNTKDFDSAMKKMQKSFDRSVRKMQRTGQSLTRNLTVPIATLAAGAVTAAVDFEDAFAGVRKTVDATESEFQGLRKGILDMTKTMPTAAGEIAGVAEAAGQLGIKTENILEFSKTMVQLGDTTNLTAQQAATSLARIANVMQIPQDRFDEMGSTIVGLGNNFATTEAEIVDMAQRISSAGKIAGFAASDVFSLSTALSSVGVAAESGGTAAQKGILAINDAVARGGDKLQTFAETAGMSAAEFSQAWKNDAASAFTDFINGLGKQGDQATITLSDVGLNSERTRAAFLSLANAGDLLNDTLEMGADEWDKNNALTEEAQKKYDTVASKLKILYNRVYSLGVTVGDILIPHLTKLMDKAESLISNFEAMSTSSQKLALKIAGIAALAGPTLIMMGKLGAAIKSIVMLAPKLVAAFGIMKAAIATNPWGAAVIAVGTLATTLGGVYLTNTERATEATNNFEEAIKNSEKSVKDAAKSLEDLTLAEMFMSTNRAITIVQEKMSALESSLRKDFENVKAAGADAGRTFEEWINHIDEVYNRRDAGDFLNLKDQLQSLKEQRVLVKKLTDLEKGRSNVIKSVGGDFNRLSEFAKEKVRQTEKDIDLIRTQLGLSSKYVEVETQAKAAIDSTNESFAERCQLLGINIASIDKIKEKVMGLNKINLEEMRVEFDKTLTKWQSFKDKFKEIGGEFKAFLANEVSGAVLSFGDAIGKSLAGADSQWKTTFEKITLVILDFAESLARLAAGIGAVMLFIPGFQGMGAGLLAAATALQALSSGFRASIEKKARRREANASQSSTNFNSISAPQRPNYSAVAMSSSGGSSGGVISNVINLDGRKIYEGMQRYQDRIS